MKTRINTAEAPMPGGAYSQAIRAGDWIFLSGQTPRNPCRDIVGDTFEEQARHTFGNLATVAAAASASLADAVKVTVYLRDWGSFDIMDAVYREFFPEPRPARTTIQSNIPVPIEAEAVLYVGR